MPSRSCGEAGLHFGSPPPQGCCVSDALAALWGAGLYLATPLVGRFQARYVPGLALHVFQSLWRPHPLRAAVLPHCPTQHNAAQPRRPVDSHHSSAIMLLVLRPAGVCQASWPGRRIGKTVKCRCGPAAVTGDERCNMPLPLRRHLPAAGGKAQLLERSGSQKTCPLGSKRTRLFRG